MNISQKVFAIHCIQFLFTFFTASQLLWNWCCILATKNNTNTSTLLMTKHCGASEDYCLGVTCAFLIQVNGPALLTDLSALWEPKRLYRFVMLYVHIPSAPPPSIFCCNSVQHETIEQHHCPQLHPSPAICLPVSTSSRCVCPAVPSLPSSS